MTLNTSYLYPAQKTRLEEAWRAHRLPLRKTPLKETVIREGYLLPPKPSEKAFGAGGVLDAQGREIPSSHLLSGGRNDLMGGSYAFDQASVPYLAGEHVYLGFLMNHWGHFLMQFSSRIWGAMKYPSCKALFLVRHGEDDFLPLPAIRRFFELAGLDNARLIFVSRPSQVEHLIIPEQGYDSGIYYSEPYVRMFDTVASRIVPTIPHPMPEKIFFSRVRVNQGYKKEIGCDLVDEVFASAGYHIVYPEEETLDNQIAYLRHCTSFATISGTLPHNLMFVSGRNIEVDIVNKTSSINTLLLETCHMAGCTPLFLDFYAMKYPTNLGIGPFIFVVNKYMERFISDANIRIRRKSLLETEFLSSCIQEYLSLYQKRWPSPEWHREISSNVHHYDYFDPALLIEWLDSYSPYETGSGHDSGHKRGFLLLLYQKLKKLGS